MLSPLRLGATPIGAERSGSGMESACEQNRPNGSLERQDFERESRRCARIYGIKLRRVKVGALLVTILHGVNGFLGFCALTWATVVILGGFVTDLTQNDFYSVSVLLLLEAGRLAAGLLFGNLFTRKLVMGSSDHRRIKYDDFRRQIIVEVFRIADQAFQLGVVATSFVVALRRLHELQGGFSRPTTFDGLYDSLYIFYVLVLANAIIAMIAVAHSKTCTLAYLTSYDLRRFYDKIVWRGMQKGLLDAKGIDIVSFGMNTQADEYRRKLRAPVVYSLYKDLIDFLYHHEKGFEVVCSALDSGDIYEKEAAANMVGLWARSQFQKNSRIVSKKKPMLCLQTTLLSKLAGAVKDDKTGRAATSSFVYLAKLDPEGMFAVEAESGEQLLNIFINSIERVVKAYRHDLALVYIKALIPVLEKGTCLRRMGAGQRNRLIRNLAEVFRKGELKRTKAIAGCALQLLTNKLQPTSEDVRIHIRNPMPKPGEHILEEEKAELLKLLLLIDEQNWPENWCDIEIRDTNCPAVSPFFARPVTSFSLSLSTLLSIVCASYLILKYVPF